jgi:3-phytase
MSISRIQLLVLISLVWASCQTGTTPKVALTEEQLEAIEDSLDYARARAKQAGIAASVVPDAETGAVLSPQADDDAADDMAIWVNAAAPDKSLLIGTNKKGGVVVFDLKGAEKAFYPTGRINNIDVMYGFSMGKKLVDIVGCSNRSDQSIDLFSINPADGALSDLAAGTLKVDTQKVQDVYGFCFYQSKRTRKPYLFVSGKNGAVQQFELIATADEKIDLKLVRHLQFDSQTEGMVADEDFGVLYVGEEDRGIWKLPAEPDAGSTRILVENSGENNPNIAYDVEGLALYKINGSGGYLLASSQGNFSYAVFERAGNNKYLTSFKITDSPSVDGVEETDGIDVVSKPLGVAYPKGMFAAQDGFNYKDGKLQRQNFKMVNWAKIEALLQNRK